jgi:segregation and condensation protein B
MTLGPADPVEVPRSREPDEAALRLAEAAVFSSVVPMTARALSQILPEDIDAEAVIAALRSRYEGRGIELSEVGGGLRFRTARDLAPVLRKIVQVPRRLPRVALETLAIVAYHQPVTRPEIEDIRGAGLSQQTLDVLLEHDLITTRGRKETPGRPTLWGTTPKFLEYFGLRDIRDLPRRQDLLLETVRPEGAGAGPEGAGPEGAAPEGAGPDGAGPEGAVPDDSQRNDSKSEDTQSEGARTDDAQPNDSQLEDSQPEGSQPEDPMREDSVPEDPVPEDPVPEKTRPEGTAEDGASGEGATEQGISTAPASDAVSGESKHAADSPVADSAPDQVHHSDAEKAARDD